MIQPRLASTHLQLHLLCPLLHGFDPRAASELARAQRVKLIRGAQKGSAAALWMDYAAFRSVMGALAVGWCQLPPMTLTHRAQRPLRLQLSVVHRVINCAACWSLILVSAKAPVATSTTALAGHGMQTAPHLHHHHGRRLC